jgi:phosphatidylglycerol---prolipoprotein diacylglyceryl transferase
MNILSIVWDVDPWLVRFSDSFGIRWYGLLFACTFLVGYFIFIRYFKKENLPVELLDQLTLYIALGTIIGARLGHCLLYDSAYYLKHPFEIVKIWEGGLASHGAALGIIVALLLFVLKNKMSYLWFMDRITIVTALGGFFIRTGNLMNSEIYGRPTSLPWGFSFIRDKSRVDFLDPNTGNLLGKHLPCHPTQLYEGLSYLLIFVILFWLNRKYGPKIKEGVIFSWFLISVFTSRFFIEYLKYEQSDFELIMINKWHINMGQALSIPFVLGGIILLILVNYFGRLPSPFKKSLF